MTQWCVTARFPIPDSRFPFPSWEGLGVGSDSLFPQQKKFGQVLVNSNA
ncbi:MAG: hypothetical protein F6J94_06150 [Moorea sp. SIO1F2]|nr:hypothetical protein [Moorena sp. SIO1F2]NET81551.1 hypothetical protein [Moorena sp. SIO1F2]